MKRKRNLEVGKGVTQKRVGEDCALTEGERW